MWTDNKDVLCVNLSWIIQCRDISNKEIFQPCMGLFKKLREHNSD